MNYLSLFSGIGGLDLGLDRAGWTCVGQVEIDAYCRAVLECHWPEVPKHDDVRTATTWWSATTRPAVRLVAGGFPCQPFSKAGRRRSTADPRWGWPWFRAVVRAVRPDYVLVENVAALVDDADAFGWLLGDLAEDGFDADWTVLSACAVGAPHTRERMFLVAHPASEGRPHRGSADLPSQTSGIDVAELDHSGWWASEPALGRVANGVAERVDRLKAIGNAVVPQVGELVGRLIREHAEGAA